MNLSPAGRRYSLDRGLPTQHPPTPGRQCRWGGRTWAGTTTTRSVSRQGLAAGKISAFPARHQHAGLNSHRRQLSGQLTAAAGPHMPCKDTQHSSHINLEVHRVWGCSFRMFWRRCYLPSTANPPVRRLAVTEPRVDALPASCKGHRRANELAWLLLCELFMRCSAGAESIKLCCTGATRLHPWVSPEHSFTQTLTFSSQLPPCTTANGDVPAKAI